MANQNEPQPQENPLSNFSTPMQEYLELQQQMIQSLTRIEESLIGIRGEFAARNSRREQEVGASINNGGGGVVASINGVGDMKAVAVPGQAESRWHDLSDMLRIVSTVGKYASYCVGVYAAICLNWYFLGSSTW